MEFMFQIPTKIIAGEGCIKSNGKEFAHLGKKALIVKTRSSEKNGSLGDITGVLQREGIAYQICASVPTNPTPQQVKELAAYDPSIDFVVAVGGGSALDAAKGVAILAANDVPESAMYDRTYPNKPLPLIAVPTTCGTGSEVTAVSVLSVGSSKQSFSSPDILPKVAFLDAQYLETLPDHVTVDTALDALSHSVEAYLLLKSWPNEMIAEQAFRNFALYKDALLSRQFDRKTRELMLYTATLGGIAIYAGGTSAVHTMGYPITVMRDVPHGRACALTLGEYIAFVYDENRAKVDTMCRLLEVDGVAGFKKLLADIMGERVTFTRKELEEFTEIAAGPAMKKKNAKAITQADIMDIYEKSLLDGE